MPRKTLKHVRRLAQLAELRIADGVRGSGKQPEQKVYDIHDIHDARDRAEHFSLYTAETLAQAEAFIYGWTQGRNREIIK